MIAIAILFIVRKHCYISQLDHHNETPTRSLFRDTIDGWKKRIQADAEEGESVHAPE